MAKSILKKKRIQIREYQPEDQELIINLLNAPSIKPDLWDWQFDRGHFASKIKPIVAEDHWGNILGFNGMMPVTLNSPELGELDAAWSCDFFVSRHCRGLGVGKEIKRELKSQSELTFALGTSPTAAIVLEKSGWVPFNKTFTFSTNKLDVLTKETPQVSISGNLPEATQINDLWERSKSALGASVKRDSSYMTWRYADSPVAKYQFISATHDGELEFVAVCHINSERASLVDYLGPHDPAIHQKILSTLSKKHARFRCMTSCPEWQNTFLEFGIQKADKPANCFIYAKDAEIAKHISKRFYLMPGDCDGDFLGSSVSQAKGLDAHSKQQYQTEQISFETFLELESEWDGLVIKSDNPSLFASWAWVKTWWKSFSTPNKFELNLFLCRHKGTLVGIAPMYTRRYRQFLLPVTQLQLIGCSWSGPNTFRSEYLDLIIHLNHSRGARIALLDRIHEQLQWSELILGDIPHASLTTRLLEESYGRFGLYSRTVHEDHSVIVNCATTEASYTSLLSANFRRSVIHKFRKLKEETSCKFTVYENKERCPNDIIETLNALHIPRWGKPCFEGIHQHFHEKLIAEFSEKNQLNIGILAIDEELSALTYNLCFAGTVYNIQLGYNEEVQSNYSLGLIHLMQNILMTIKSSDLNSFDLLAGFGKKEYYKERFGGHIRNISTKQYLKGSWVKLVYRVYDKLNTLKKDQQER